MYLNTAVRFFVLLVPSSLLSIELRFRQSPIASIKRHGSSGGMSKSLQENIRFWPFGAHTPVFEPLRNDAGQNRGLGGLSVEADWVRTVAQIYLGVHLLRIGVDLGVFGCPWWASWLSRFLVPLVALWGLGGFAWVLWGSGWRGRWGSFGGAPL